MSRVKENEMNGIQKYLIEVALHAARDAAGKYIADGSQHPVLVAQSLEELVQEIKNLDAHTESEISCPLKYKGYEMTKDPSSGMVSFRPLFAQPLENIEV